jgi:uncharacterized protein
MTQDADSAWQYLITSRTTPEQQIIPYGAGIGAFHATRLATIHKNVPALMLDTPRTDLLDVAMHDQRAALVPVRLLFHERFPLADPLSTLRTPKLLLSRSTAPDKPFLTASDPKMSVELTKPSAVLYQESLTRFLDQYLPPASIPALVPASTPAH